MGKLRLRPAPGYLQSREIIKMKDLEDKVIEHIKALMNDQEIPELTETLAGIPHLPELHKQLVVLREIVFTFSKGDLSCNIATRGFIAGCLKSLQAHLRHLIWQVQQVESGDFSQQVEFLGEFSLAFNNMVLKLDSTLNALRKKEEALTALTDSLRSEVDLRGSAMEALQQSEARFKYLASHDSLTGALNRSSFIEKTMLELTLAAQCNTPCCLAILDVDHFKKFNDTYGHLAGDTALKQVVEISLKALRNADVMGRYGGEEFIFLFPGASLHQGCRVADRIRQAVENSIFPINNGRTNVTVSIGVSVALPECNKPNDAFLRLLINAADMALYKAKTLGRNRVVYHVGSVLDENSHNSEAEEYNHSAKP